MKNAPYHADRPLADRPPSDTPPADRPPADTAPTDHPDPALEWADGLRVRGWGDALLTALDAFEPLTPIGAQILWVAQPALGLFGGGGVAGALARLLETPEGVAALRLRLGADDAE